MFDYIDSHPSINISYDTSAFYYFGKITKEIISDKFKEIFLGYYKCVY